MEFGKQYEQLIEVSAHLCRSSEDTELQLCTDSSVEDFRGPRGDGNRLVLDGDGESRLMFPGELKEPLRHSSSSSALPASLKPVSDGRTRMGGTVRNPATDLWAGQVFTSTQLPDKPENIPLLLLLPGSRDSPAAAAAEPRSAPSRSVALWWRLPPFSSDILWTGRPSREMLLKNKRAACLRREFSRFLRPFSVFLPLTAADTAALCWPQAAAAAAMVSVPPTKSTAPHAQLSNPFYPARDRFKPCRALIGSNAALRHYVELYSPQERYAVYCKSGPLNYKFNWARFKNKEI